MIQLDYQPSPAKLRQFGFAGAVFGLLMAALWCWRHGWTWGTTATVWCAVAGAFLLLALAAPTLLRWPFVGMSLVTFPIGWVLSWVLTAIVYFVVLTPIALILRLWKRDALGRRPAPPGATESFLTARPPAPPVRQYLRPH